MSIMTLCFNNLQTSLEARLSDYSDYKYMRELCNLNPISII